MIADIRTELRHFVVSDLAVKLHSQSNFAFPFESFEAHYEPVERQNWLDLKLKKPFKLIKCAKPNLPECLRC